MTTKIINARVYTDNEFKDIDIYVNNGKISFKAQAADEVIDAEGKMLLPGFIDIHIHGAVGYDFNDGTDEALDNITAFVAKHGTTSVLATTSTIGAESEKNAINKIVEKLQNGTAGASIVGLHMEGPFFSPKALGAQNPEFVQAPSMENLKNMIGDNIAILKLIAIAPECDKDMATIKELTQMGIRTAIGHTKATYAEATAALEAGATMLTHFYNAMTPLNHRDPGVVGAVLENGNAEIQLITDLIHLHPAAIRVATRAVGDDNVIIISDAIAGTGLGDGVYDLGGLDVYVKDGVARIKEGNLAGSTLTLDVALKNMVDIGYAPETAVKYLTENPARAIGISDRKGKLAEGMDADLVIINDDYEVENTFVEGRLVYKK